MKIYSHYGYNEFVRLHKASGYMHKGYWQCMDTLSEKLQIEKLWND